MELLYFALPLFALGALSMLMPKRFELAAHVIGMLCATVASGLTAMEAGSILIGLHRVVSLGFSTVRFGTYSLTLDGWSAAFLGLTGVAGTITSLYALDYARAYRGTGLRALTGLWNLFLGSMVLVLLAGDAFTFIFAWEVMALVSFLLVNQESAKKKTVVAAYQYMVMTHLGTAAILTAFYLLGSHAESFAFSDLAHNTLTGTLRHVAFCAAFLGFALKSGLMPLHVWLPNAHPAAPSHVSALMSGVMLKIAVYGFGRFVFTFLDMHFVGYGLLVLFAGLISAFLGVLYATMETDMKRILAYSSVENMGVIFSMFGCGMLLVQTGHAQAALVAFTAVLVHSYVHSCMKALLFMSAGAVMHATETKNIERLGGLAKKMPWTALFTLVGSMSLASLPFTGGLVGEWLGYQSFITLGWQTASHEMRLVVIAAFILLGLTGALALACFVRLFGVVFLGRARSAHSENAHEMPFFMLFAMGTEAIILLTVGLCPAPLVKTMQHALVAYFPAAPMTAGLSSVVWSGLGEFYQMDSYAFYNPLFLFLLLLIIAALLALCVEGKTRYVRKGVTWNCGTVPTARQQYSATGLSKPLRRAFDSILHPHRERVFLKKEHDYFGREIEYTLQIPDRFSATLYHPIEQWMVRASNGLRLIQQGSVRLYIGYTMLAMLVVLLWGVM